ncbi:MAG: caspase family protein [Myxococcota bacterium]
MLGLLLLLSVAFAGVTRFAVFVGNDEGATGSPPLYFAESDAEKMHRLFTTIGGVDPKHAYRLMGQNRNDLLTTLGRDQLRADIAAAKAQGDDTMLFFYYAGHADKEKIQLGHTAVTWTELEALLERSGADVRVAFLDACQSGAMTRSRGGQRAPGFILDLTERLDAQGQVIITSSASDEASQESDEIGGGYFTYFLASALSGAADHNQDGRVTLVETYDYVYTETRFKTAATRAGQQKPVADFDLNVQGDVVLAERTDTSATLILPPDLAASYAIFDLRHRQFIAKVDIEDDERRLTLPPSAYLVQVRHPTHLLSAEVQLRERGTVTVQPDDFKAFEYENDLARGAINRQIRKAQLPRMALRANLGNLTFNDTEVQAQYFPSIPMAGVSSRWHWQKERFARGERWASIDLGAGSGGGVVELEPLEDPYPVRINATTVGVAAGFATRRRFVQAGLGLRLAGIYLTRDFPGQDVERQSLLTASPGLATWIGIRPGAWEIDLTAHSQVLPYALDNPDLRTGYTEGYLTIGYRF